MPRSLPEWIGRAPSTPVPPRVRLRVFARDGGVCQCGCNRRIGRGARWATDHIVALANGGINHETNLRTLLMDCHVLKTAEDVLEKSRIAVLKANHLGLRKSSRPLPGGRDSGQSKTLHGGVVSRQSQAEKHRALMMKRFGERA